MHIKSLKKGMLVRTDGGATGRLLHDYKSGEWTYVQSLDGSRKANFVTKKLAFVQRGDEWHTIQRGNRK